MPNKFKKKLIDFGMKARSMEKPLNAFWMSIGEHLIRQ